MTAQARRRVKRTVVSRLGVTLTLECGHRVWHAGRADIPDFAECLEGPCYHPQRRYDLGEVR